MRDGSGSTTSRVARALAAVLLLAAVALSGAACGGDGTGPAGGSPAPSGVSEAPGRQNGVQNGALLGVPQFAALVARPGITVLDVRTPAEFASGHLAGAVNIDVQGPGFNAAVAALAPEGTYAVYCHSGSRSAVATARMLDRGFVAVYQLEGGITAWTAAGRPVTTS